MMKPIKYVNIVEAETNKDAPEDDEIFENKFFTWCLVGEKPPFQFDISFFWFTVLYFFNDRKHKIGWFRFGITGYGIGWKHIAHGLLFSEMYGRKRFIKIGSWYIKFLIPV
jgi:hypothetical protein